MPHLAVATQDKDHVVKCLEEGVEVRRGRFSPRFQARFRGVYKISGDSNHRQIALEIGAEIATKLANVNRLSSIRKSNNPKVGRRTRTSVKIANSKVI